jgi:hypothetical protein
MSAVQNAGGCLRRATNVKPMRDERRASFCWTSQQVPAASVARNFDLTATKYSLAHNANALVIERIPFPQPIGLAQNLKAFFRRKMSAHCHAITE